MESQRRFVYEIVLMYKKNQKSLSWLTKPKVKATSSAISCMYILLKNSNVKHVLF